MAVDLMRRSSACIHAPTISTAASKSCVLTVLFESTFLPSYCPFISHPASRSIDWVQDTVTATTKWGAIGDWDVSGVEDFSHAFSRHRNEAGAYSSNGNGKSYAFVGTGLAKWNTASVKSLENSFYYASKMNADLTAWTVTQVTTLKNTFNMGGASKFKGTGLHVWITASVTSLESTFFYANEMTTDLSSWNVAKVTTMYGMFRYASKFEGTGLDTWDVAKVTNMAGTFSDMSGSIPLTSCNKRKIADAWNGNPHILTWATTWANEKCTKVRDGVRMMRCDGWDFVMPRLCARDFA